MRTQRSEEKTVALVGLNRDLLELMEPLLVDEGYRARTFHFTPAVVDELASAHPDLILFEAGRRPETLALLDALRMHPQAGAILVIVLGTNENLQVQAQASGNVYVVLPMPFELEDLLGAIQGALHQAPFEARVQAEPDEPSPALRQAADILGRSEREIMLDWVQRIRLREPFAQHPGLSIRDFLDGVPRLLNVLRLVLNHEVGAEVLSQDEDAHNRIVHHASARREQGIPAEGVVGEYQVLRDVIIKRLRQEMAAEDVLVALEGLNALIDDIVRITVAEYTRLAQSGSS